MEGESTFSDNALLFYLSIFVPRCTYCSFVPHDGIEQVMRRKAYIDAVLEVRGAWYPPEAIYIGGDSTALELNCLKNLCRLWRHCQVGSMFQANARSRTPRHLDR